MMNTGDGNLNKAKDDEKFLTVLWHVFGNWVFALHVPGSCNGFFSLFNYKHKYNEITDRPLE